MALEQSICYLLLGSNLGDRKNIIDDAIRLLEERLGKIILKSSLYETAAWGKTDQASFINQAIALQTNYGALEVLNCALNIEQELGRVRKEKWGERTIDIDLLLFDSEVINLEDKLQVPHPQMQNRKFVMEPMAEIAADVIHPVINKTILQIFENINDDLSVKRL